MVTATKGPPAPAPQAPAPQGHCSRCGKVWTLKENTGICQWCGKRSTCQTNKATPRHVNSSRRRRPVPTKDNGYDQLTGRYAVYYKVASRFNHKAKAEDTEDLLHDIIYHLARVEQSKPLTEAAMYRTAEHVKDHYWYDLRKRTSGLDCGHCSKAQRHKCKEHWLYGDCPKAIKLESLNKPIIDSEGNITEFGDLIADDTAIDLDAWLDSKTFLRSCPQRLKRIALKLRDGEGLTGAENFYLHKWRKREQIKLL